VEDSAGHSSNQVNPKQQRPADGKRHHRHRTHEQLDVVDTDAAADGVPLGRQRSSSERGTFSVEDPARSMDGMLSPVRPSTRDNLTRTAPDSDEDSSSSGDEQDDGEALPGMGLNGRSTTKPPALRALSSIDSLACELGMCS